MRLFDKVDRSLSRDRLMHFWYPGAHLQIRIKGMPFIAALDTGDGSWDLFDIGHGVVVGARSRRVIACNPLSESGPDGRYRLA